MAYGISDFEQPDASREEGDGTVRRFIAFMLVAFAVAVGNVSPAFASAIYQLMPAGDPISQVPVSDRADGAAVSDSVEGRVRDDMPLPRPEKSMLLPGDALETLPATKLLPDSNAPPAN